MIWSGGIVLNEFSKWVTLADCLLFIKSLLGALVIPPGTKAQDLHFFLFIALAVCLLSPKQDVFVVRPPISLPSSFLRSCQY